jgi:SepF-like predicted cell division protein (DUF552 family)
MKLLQTLTVCSIAAIGSVSEASDVISQGGLPVVDMSVLLEPQTEVYSTHAQSAVRLNAMLSQHKDCGKDLYHLHLLRTPLKLFYS